jgi:hypothetical protein
LIRRWGSDQRAVPLNHLLRIKAEAVRVLRMMSLPVNAAPGRNIFHRAPDEGVLENIVIVGLLSG